MTDTEKMKIVAKHIDLMVETIDMIEPKPKDTRIRTESRKEYMKNYYKNNIDQFKKRYTPREKKKKEIIESEKIPENI